MYRIVNHWGELYRLGERNYRLYLASGIEGKDPNPTDFGGKFIGVICFHSIDAKPIDYQNEMDRIIILAAKRIGHD